MATIRNLLVKIGLKGAASTKKGLKDVERGQAGVKKEIKKTGNEADKSSKKVTRFFRKMIKSYRTIGHVAQMAAVGLGILVGVQGILIGYTAMYAEQIERLATGFNMTTTEAQGLVEVFHAMGGTTDDATDALTTLTDRMQDVIANKNKGYAKEFKSIGMSRQDIKDNLESPYKALTLFMDKALKAKKLSDKIAVAARIFGDDLGRRLVPMFVAGGDNFKKYIKMFAQFNLFISSKRIKTLRKLMFEARKFMVFFKGLGRYLSAELSPMLLKLSTRLLGVILNFKDMAQSSIVKWAKMLGEEFSKILLFLESLTKKLGGGKGIIELIDMLTELTPAILVLGAAFTVIMGSSLVIALFAKLSIAGIALAGAVGTAGLLVEDLWVFLQGGESLIGRLVGRFFQGKRAIKKFSDAMEMLGKASDTVFDAFAFLIEQLSKEGPDGMNTFEAALLFILEVLVDVITIIVGFIRILSILFAVFIFLTGVIDGVRKSLQELGEEFMDFVDKVTGTKLGFSLNGGWGKSPEASKEELEAESGPRKWLRAWGKMTGGPDPFSEIRGQREFQSKRNIDRANMSIDKRGFGATGSEATKYAQGDMLSPTGMLIHDLNVYVSGTTPAEAKANGKLAGIAFKEEVKAANAANGKGRR